MEEYEEDNLENFFRNRAEDDQYKFQEGDWEKMEAKLEAADLKAGGFSFTKFFWMLLGSLITSVLFISYIQFAKPEIGMTVAENKKPVATTSVQDKKNQTEHLEKTSSSIDNPRNNSSVDSEQKSPQSIEYAVSTNDQVVDSQPVEYNSVVAGFGSTGADKARLISVKSDKAVFLTTQETQETNKVSKVSSIFEPYQTKEITAELLSADTIHATYQFSVIPLSTSEIVKKPKEESLKLKRFYSLGIVAGLDISSTKESSWGTPTMRIGLSGEYFVTNRLSVGVGVNISEKKYSAMGREYAPPKGFWTNGVVPDSTNAVCQVLDIPITVSYFQPVGRKSSIIFHAGMSSWFMLKEDYWYKYDSNDPDLVNWWGGENENRYWFGVVNMAVSYEYMISNKWSVLAGPYINIPITGIGHGNVDLRSFGMRASLRLNKYKLHNKF